MKKGGQSKARMTNVGHPPLPEGSGPFQHLKGLLLLRKIQNNSPKGYLHHGESSGSTAAGAGCRSGL